MHNVAQSFSSIREGYEKINHIDQLAQGERPRDQHVDAAILEAALCLLEQHGLRAVTLEGIAKETGVARTTVYRDGRTKRRL
jgi:AcrR family transcriptional regulator